MDKKIVVRISIEAEALVSEDCDVDEAALNVFNYVNNKLRKGINMDGGKADIEFPQIVGGMNSIFEFWEIE